ncbi:MAG: PAS domain S-box protein, partial [Methanosarcinaceae archaeon]|nr:PAS domain S-box protein [Methanosarcinaceae archaeon]
MKPSENDKKMDDLRKKIIGLGETSHRKSYYPQLKKQINELSRAMHALQEKETKLQSFIDNVPVGMFQMSSEGRVILTNPKMAHILGQDTPEQAVSYLRNI